jgi:hypothetical protein
MSMSQLSLFGSLLGAFTALQAQTPRVVTAGTFTPGAQILFSSDFSQDPLGNFPRGLKYLRGPMEVVAVGGVPMLRSTGPAEFIIPLAAPLPQDFTLEFDIVSRNSDCCAGEELAFEGSPNLNRSIGSAWVAWHHQYAEILGGGQDLGTSTVRFPEILQRELKGRLGHIQVMMSGSQFRLYTNGRPIYNIPNLVFRRTTALRVFLGGVNDGDGAVYLARVTLAAGSGMLALQPPSGPGGPGSPGPQPVTPKPGLPAPPGRAYLNPARCIPGAGAGAGPLEFKAFGIRVGGASLRWENEPNTEYLIERAAAPPVPAAGSPTWTRLISTCDPAGNILSSQALEEDGIVHQYLNLLDVYPGVRMGDRYQYRLTAIHPNATSGSFIIFWEAQTGSFRAPPVATVSGSTVTITTGVSYCYPIGPRCDPMALEFTVINSSTGFSYTRQQPWFDNSNPTIPGSEPGTLAYAITGVPPGTHTFVVTALYQPDLRVAAGVVTIQVP